jgi:hypothetical protein
VQAPLRVAIVLGVLMVASGCQTSSSRIRPDNGYPRPTGRSSDVLGFAEIQTVRVNNAHEAVVRFRPEFLRRHGSPASADPAAGYPTVYLDGVRQGSPDLLRSIPIAAVLEIRYLSASAASDQFGPFNPGGVLAVRTR